MGVWTRANGKLEVLPSPNDELLVAFWEFNRKEWPDDYKRIDEYFSNTWFFDENNKLACTAGKFAEAWVWLDWMKKYFFEPQGYELLGEPDFIGEGNQMQMCLMKLWKKSIGLGYEGFHF